MVKVLKPSAEVHNFNLIISGLYVNYQKFYFRGFGRHEDSDIRLQKTKKGLVRWPSHTLERTNCKILCVIGLLFSEVKASTIR